MQTFHEFYSTCEQIYGFINSRRDHTLEGWREAGHEVVQYLLGETLLDEQDDAVSAVQQVRALMFIERFRDDLQARQEWFETAQRGQ